MRVIHGIENITDCLHSVVTIGTFDGVHTGHQKIIQQLNEIAHNAGSKSVVITFDPHPRKFLKQDSVRLLSLTGEKLHQFEKLGVNITVIIDFNQQFASQAAHVYISDFIVKKFAPKAIIIGYDHRFGNDRLGDIRMLQSYAEANSYRVIEIPAQQVDDINISSTKIRNFLMEGDVQQAANLLGRFYSISGVVVHGEKKGRELGFPTANIGEIDSDKLVPADGVYAVYAFVGAQRYMGMMNIGNRPVFQNFSHCLEVNLFEFNQDIYGAHIRVEFVKRLRDELKLQSVNELIDYMQRDKEESLELFKSIHQSPD